MTLPPTADDPINPAHYNRSAIKPIDAIEAWGLGFNLGTVVKYVARAGHKPDSPLIEDLKKALWYLNREITNLERAESESEED